MLKFIRNYADKIDHVQIFPLIGLFIFIGFFILMVIYVKKMSNKEINELSHLPLDLDEENVPAYETKSVIRNA
jgi:cytochrome c oxidase cbb3-type subunit IV